MQFKIYFNYAREGVVIHGDVIAAEKAEHGLLFIDCLTDLGFGLTADEQYTANFNLAKYWIPPSQITLIELVRNDNEEEKHETETMSEGGVQKPGNSKAGT